VWEAAMFASTHKLNNLTVIVDDNKFQGFGATKEVHGMNLKNLWKSFGWKVIKCDGHNLSDLERALLEAKKDKLPSVVIADTVNGKGIPEKHKVKIFEMFSKLENGSNAAGVGLALVKKITGLLNGNVWLESKADMGATFYITLKKE